jgi:hypothetical protein
MGFDALDSGSGVVGDSVVSCGFPLIFNCEETEFVMVGATLPRRADHRGHEPLLASHKVMTATRFGDGQQRLRPLRTHSSLENSAIDLQQRRSVTPREAFLSPQTCSLTIVYLSGNQGTRSRLSRRPSLPSSR